MTSQLNVDTIVDKAGSGGTNVKIANNSVTVAEGGSATTTTVQGLCKHWTQLDTQVVVDSFNQTGITDNSAADATFNFTNNMNNAHYSVGGLSCATTTNPYSTLGFFTDMPSTSSYRTHAFYSTTMRTSDVERSCVNTFGDLA